MRPSSFLALLWLVLPLSSAAQGTFRVHFDQASYSVSPSSSISVAVLIDPVPDAGLFSYGVKLVFDEAMARVESASAISLPPPLDFNGVLGPGAVKAVGNGFAAVKGTVDFFASPLEPHSGSLLATLELRNLSVTVGQTYPLLLEIYRTLGPAESVFVTGSGEVLDAAISFESAVLTVVPEPATSLLILIGIAAALRCGERSSRKRLFR